MAKNKKPTKKYRPRVLIKDPLNFVVAGCKPADPQAVTKVKISHHMAMLAMTQGHGGREEWQEIANALNAGIILAEMGYGIEYVPDMEKAQGAMVLIRDRLKETGRITLRAFEMQAINEALALHDEQLEIAPVRDISRAILEVEKQIARGNFVRVLPSEQPPPSSQSLPVV